MKTDQPTAYSFEIHYFDYFQISQHVKFFVLPFKGNNGCVVVKDQAVFIYFREPQINLHTSVQVISASLNARSALYSEEFSDLILFLQSIHIPASDIQFAINSCDIHF